MDRPAPTPATDMRRAIMLAAFVLLQIAGSTAIVIDVASPPSPRNPWPAVVVFGVGLAQCSLAAAATVFAPFAFWRRLLAIASVVVVSAEVLLIGAWKPSIEDVVLFPLFGLLLWAMNQVPLWPVRLLLNARTVVDGVDCHSPARAQYGIRQLMGLTFGISLLLGTTRLLVPMTVFEQLKNMNVVDWLLFGITGLGSGLILATTVMATLNPYYWRVGVAVSGASSALIAFGVYSVVGSLGRGPATERVLFAVMILCTYSWLQISLLLVRAAGYRIVVRT